MENTKSRLDELSHLILNVASEDSSDLNLTQLPDSQLIISRDILKEVPQSLRDDDLPQSLSRGFEYFTPGKTVVILGCKNRMINYIAARGVAPGGSVINCYNHQDHREQLKSTYSNLEDKELPDLQFWRQLFSRHRRY